MKVELGSPEKSKVMWLLQNTHLPVPAPVPVPVPVPAAAAAAAVGVSIPLALWAVATATPTARKATLLTILTVLEEHNSRLGTKEA